MRIAEKVPTSLIFLYFLFTSGQPRSTSRGWLPQVDHHPHWQLSIVKKHWNPGSVLRIRIDWQRIVKIAFDFGVAAVSGITTDPDLGGRATTMVITHLGMIQTGNCFPV